MTIRPATIHDIRQIQIVRNSVKENQLSDPGLVTDKDCEAFLTMRGKGWVCEVEQQIVGFAIVDIQDHNIWALFLMPEFEGQGIGQSLHNIMLDWYFERYRTTIWLGTAPGTRAQRFYRLSGWIEIGKHGKGEIKFQMTFSRWQEINAKNLT